MGRNRWARLVYEWNQKGKFIRKCLALCKKYNFRKVWQVHLDNSIPHWIFLTERAEAARWSNEKWKECISQRVADKGLDKWKSGMEGKKTLEYYKNKELPKVETIYDGSFNGVLFFKARTLSLEVKSRTYRWSEDQSKICQVCCQEEESLQHLLAECVGYQEIRSAFIGEIIEILGLTAWGEVSTREDYGIAYLLGLGGRVKEGVMEKTKTYLGRVWAVRQSKLEGQS